MRQIVFVVLATLSLSSCSIEHPTVVSLPESGGFYAKSLDCGGVVIRGSRAVNDKAFTEACSRVERMLGDIPAVRRTLVDKAAELHIIGRNEVTSDLPEWRFKKNRIYIDNLGHLADIDVRTRGMGGLTASCGEENLLHFPGDRYAGEDICIHEFAHTIMDYGVPAQAISLIRQSYHASINSGRWEKNYAAVNANEYFAELSEWYFGAHGQFLDWKRRFPSAGRSAMRAYDPEGYAMMDTIYDGGLPMQRAGIVAATFLPVCGPSEPGGRPADIVFANNLNQPVKAEWIGFQGNRRVYTTITPYDRVEISTRLHHVWTLVDVNDHPLGCWRVESSSSIITVGH